jgi:hypothetical protein
MLSQTGEMEEMKKCKKINMETLIEVGLVLLGTITFSLMIYITFKMIN